MGNSQAVGNQGLPRIRRFAIVRRNNGSIRALRLEVEHAGFRVDQASPQAVLCVGGDGTFLSAERLFPGIPKILVRESFICAQCEDLSLQAALEKVKRGEFRVEVHGKLELRCHGGKIQKPSWGSKPQKHSLTVPAVKKHLLLAVNDVIIRNKDVTKALRFQLRVGKNQIGEVLIGDGIVVSTPFGSSGYFFSIAQSSFSKGVGIAFNNPTIPRKPLIVGRTQQISLCVVRNNAVVAVDNDPRMQVLHEGDNVEVRSSKNSAKMVRFV